MLTAQADAFRLGCYTWCKQAGLSDAAARHVAAASDIAFQKVNAFLTGVVSVETRVQHPLAHRPVQIAYKTARDAAVAHAAHIVQQSLV